MRHETSFNFAGQWSHDMGVIKFNLDGDLFEDTLISSKRIVEDKVAGKDRPYFYGVERDSLSFNVDVYFDNNLSNDKIREVLRWLDTDTYKPFYMEDSPERVWYAMPVDDVNVIHNGVKSGYVSLNMRTDNTTTLAPYTKSDLYQLRDNTSKFIEFENSGDFDCKPNIYIRKYGSGDISIKNLSNNNGEFKLISINDKEQLFIDCENKEIETDAYVHRYDDFNGNYLEFKRGINRLKVVGDCDIQFETEFKMY